MAIRGRRPLNPSALPGLGTKPIAYRTIAEQIAAVLRDAIAGGTIRPSSRLLEVELARQMGTSRAPVREALALLEREGLVVKEPNRGTRVVELTPETVREVASLRGVLESFAASLAVKRLTPVDFETLEAILGDMQRRARKGDFLGMVERDYQFHDYIMRASGHRLLYQAWLGMDRKIRVFLSATNMVYADMKTVVEGHIPILQALRGRNAKQVSQVMSEHLGDVEDFFLAKVMREKLPPDRDRSKVLRDARHAIRLAVKRLER